MIVVIDYGMGNLRSVFNALDVLGADVKVSDDPRDLGSAEKIILPGVGAFGVVMANLKQMGWEEAVRRQVVQEKKPMLGICLGMQVLADEGTERGRNKGFGFISGRVERLTADRLRLPHIGWNDVDILMEHPLFQGFSSKAIFYFVHSFHFIPHSDRVVAGTCEYGQVFTAAVAKDNIFATQFHPEKSQAAGLRFLENFIDWHGGTA